MCFADDGVDLCSLGGVPVVKGGYVGYVADGEGLHETEEVGFFHAGVSGGDPSYEADGCCYFGGKLGDRESVASMGVEVEAQHPQGLDVGDGGAVLCMEFDAVCRGGAWLASVRW